MNGPLFPIWQVDRGEYEVVCAYLGLQPDPAVYEQLLAHLAEVAVTHQPGPGGFARALARGRLTRWRITRLDLATRLFFPGHPVRHVLNAAVALHECTGDGYGQLSRSPTGGAVWSAVVAWMLQFAGNLVVTLPWLALQAGAWALHAPFARERSLAGQRVLVTGVGRGLGRDLMLECLERGAKVLGTVRTEQGRSEVAQLLPAAAPLKTLVADLSQPGSLAQALKAAGVTPSELDAVIFCAGVKHDGHPVLDAERLRDTLQVNLLSCAEAAAWLYADPARGPRALGVVSSMGRWHGMHSTAGYNASKAALSIWAESLEMDFARRPGMHPTVTVVEPGLFESGMSQAAGARGLLFVPRRRVASRIVDAVTAGRRSLRVPGWFALLTWAVCAAGRGARLRLFARAKTGPSS